jgi:hypothetical protein
LPALSPSDACFALRTAIPVLVCVGVLCLSATHFGESADVAEALHSRRLRKQAEQPSFTFSGTVQGGSGGNSAYMADVHSNFT